MPKPVIAAVNGAASGGGFALALASDIVIAAEGTRFGTAFLAMGLSGDSGISFFLSRVLGIHRAKRLLFTGEVLDAAAAKEMGFVSQIVKRAELMAEARKVATKLAHGPTLAIARAKELFNSGLTQGLETQLEYESAGMLFTAKTEDFEEAANAFFEKRAVVFRGR
jgi:2-(1,2-epoxy-1,2-dihydrophenyl)acetyl-CoA isomerase